MNGKDSPKAQPRAPATVRSGDRARVPFRSCRFARSPSRGRPCAVILALPVQGAELRGASNQGALDGRAAGRTGSGKAQPRAVPLQPNQGELYLHCTLSLSTSFALPCGKHFTAPLLRGVRRKIVPPPLAQWCAGGCKRTAPKSKTNLKYIILSINPFRRPASGT